MMQGRWRAGRLLAAAICAISLGGAAGLSVRVFAHPGKLSAGDDAAALASSSKLPPPNAKAVSCPSAGVVAQLTSAQPGDTAAVPNPPQVFSSQAVGLLGGTVRVTRPQTAPPQNTVAVELGGQVAGKGSCDFSLADNSQAALHARAGAAALAAQGFPLRSDGARVAGEQEYLLRSSAFLSGLSYILYIVPDPQSIEPRTFNGLPVYSRNLYAIAAIASDGTVRYAAPLVQ